jgi:SAM-dependent methyltransferase
MTKSDAPNSPVPAGGMRSLTNAELTVATTRTIGHYDGSADSFWQGTKDHDVSQNVEALLRHIKAPAPLRILDLGCGPGRDLVTFRDLGHEPVGLDGSPRFVEMARAHSGCEVLHQDLLALDLPADHFDGIFANAVLFHVPTQELPRVLGELRDALRRGGVLFVSNPRGADTEEWHGARYGAYLTLPTWRRHATQAGYAELEHYYRPAGRPRAEQPWLASVWRKA